MEFFTELVVGCRERRRAEGDAKVSALGAWKGAVAISQGREDGGGAGWWGAG